VFVPDVFCAGGGFEGLGGGSCHGVELCKADQRRRHFWMIGPEFFLLNGESPFE
jgi:hypothetical protein